MKLITDAQGIAHLMATARTRAAVHRLSAVFCRLQTVRNELFNSKSPRWGPSMLLGYEAMAKMFDEKAEAIVACRQGIAPYGREVGDA